MCFMRTKQHQCPYIRAENPHPVTPPNSISTGLRFVSAAHISDWHNVYARGNTLIDIRSRITLLPVRLSGIDYLFQYHSPQNMIENR